MTVADYKCDYCYDMAGYRARTECFRNVTTYSLLISRWSLCIPIYELETDYTTF